MANMMNSPCKLNAMKPWSAKFLGRLVIWCLIMGCLSGCCGKTISLFSDYLTKENLASFHVETPDPNLCNPPFGQRLFLTWSLKHLKQPCDMYSDLRVQITIRFKNREQIVKEVKLLKNSGTYVYYLLNEDFCRMGGIMTYKAILYGDGCPLEEWRHQLWAELIEMEADDDEWDALEAENCEP